VPTATAPSHRENTAMTFAEIALKIANMLAMLTHHAGRLKMPRPAAYRSCFGNPRTSGFSVTISFAANRQQPARSRHL